MFEFIEKVVYINLDHRTDRREQVESELKKYFPSEKIIRFSAILDTSHGGIGCSKSHIDVLNMAITNNWKNYLVVEDDSIWNKFDIGYPILQRLVQNPFDVILLGTVRAHYDPNTLKLFSGQSGTAYIVSQPYYQTLLENLNESLQGFLHTGDYPTYALDQYWKRIQPLHNWFCVIPSLIIQREGYSDIEKQHLNYGPDFS
jgi:glycosyl transferase family 25